MSTFYAVCVIALAFHLIAVPAAVWAFKTRQWRESDQEAYRTVRGDATARRATRPVQPAVLRPVSPLRLRLFFGMIITMLVLMCSAQVYLAVAASRAPSAMQTSN